MIAHPLHRVLNPVEWWKPSRDCPLIFNTLTYFFLFLIPSAVLFRVSPATSQPWICATSGVAFFVYFSATQFGGWWGAACALILLWEAMFRSLYRPGARACLVGIVISVGVLGVFKYWNFVTGVLTIPLVHNPIHWNGAFLPLGISFFTFEFIHYATDRYNNKVERGTFGEYLAFIFFFPTMVAGPIKRFQDFVPCLRNPSADWATDWNRGVTRILTGLVKKFSAADLLTSLTDHLNPTDIAHADRWILPIWLIAYGWKIYFDFSAYSDIAIGSGRLFGLKIPENFDWPYARANINEFWRHWHMSLYKWLVDYVFIPLGGSRGTTAFVSRNIMIVMLVSGMWHGAGANFVVWGAWHGVLLVVRRVWSGGRSAPGAGSCWGRFASWLLTYTSVTLGWAFFAMDLGTATFFLRRMILG